MLLIGPHIEKTYVKDGNMYENIVESIRISKENANFTFNTIAFFVVGPRNYIENLTEEDKRKIPTLNLNIYVHNSYISVPWSNDLRSISYIHHQLHICDKIKAKGFIIHLPNLDIDNVISILPKLYDPEIFVRIYLEIPSINPKKSIYHKTTELNKLINSIKNNIDQNMLYFGICIDTAHLWACGVDISDYKSAELWLNELDIDPRYILIHCNDSEKLLGNPPDIHSPLTQGKIWSDYKNRLTDSGLYAFIKYAYINKIPVVLERKPNKLLLNDYIIIQQLI